MVNPYPLALCHVLCLELRPINMYVCVVLYR